MGGPYETVESGARKNVSSVATGFVFVLVFVLGGWVNMIFTKVCANGSWRSNNVPCPGIRHANVQNHEL